MPTTSCDDCGKGISVHAEQCPHCGSPAKYALQSWQRQVEEAERAEQAEKAEQAEDEVLFDDNEVIVTKYRFITPGQTYSMRNITSINLKVERWVSKLFYFLGYCLLFGICWLLINHGISDTSIVYALLLLLITGIGCFYCAYVRPTHTIRITTSAGQVTALKSKDQQRVENIVEALEHAISLH